MSNDADERERFRLLMIDADRARLATPEDLRGRADRRTAMGAAAGTVALVVLVAGVLIGGNGLLGNASPEPPVVDTPTPTTTETGPRPKPTRAATPLPTTIPAAAWLSAEDLNGERHPADEPDLPELCADPLLPESFEGSDSALTGTMLGSYRAPQVPSEYTPDGTISQTIVLLAEAPVAQRLMLRMQASVAACVMQTELDPGDLRYSLPDTGLPLSSARPDDHLIVEINGPGLDLGDGNADPPRIDTYVSVVRVGQVVTFLTARGWEASDTDIDQVRLLASAATVRLLDWGNA